MQLSFLKYCTFSAIVFFSFLTPVKAQTSVWDKPKDNTKKALKKVDKGKKKIKQWKDHIEQWGLDEEYTHQLSIGGKANSNGWSGCIYYFKRIDEKQEQVFSLSFSEIKHEKQIKQQDIKNPYPELGSPSPYIFGKINNLYTLQLGHGREFILLPGVIDGNISVGMRLTGGLSLAMLKPYYLRIVYEEYTQLPPTLLLEEEKYSNENEEAFLKTGNKLGASPWGKGIGETKYIPGAFLEAAVVIEPTPAKWFIQTITIGTNWSAYAKKLPIMAKTKAYQWQASVFVGLCIGKRL